MSIFEPDYSMTNPGTPGWEQAPIPWWGQNPMAAGPRRVGVGQLDANSDLPVLHDGAGPHIGVEQTIARYQPSPSPAYALALGQRSCGCGSLGQNDRYQQVSWGHVAAAAAAGIFFGLIIGWTAGKRAA